MRHFKLLLLCLLGLFAIKASAQVTSAGLTGIVVDDSSKAVEGAVVKATHTPSGSVYGTTTEKNGKFFIQNMRVGGPYQVEVTYGGSNTKTFNDIFLTLGETYNLYAPLTNEVLSEVKVTGSRDPLFNNQRFGAGTQISQQQLSTLPSVSRSIFDFTRLTPQASGQNIMGRDSRYNNFQINGANFNNSFGLSAGFPGGAQPFSLDAVEQVQVAIAPFDVRQSNFTGANINVVTRSGTNDISGSVYDFWNNETFYGKKVKDYTLTLNKSQTNTAGFRIGGPIIKNKLFFFVNAETERTVAPGSGSTWVASAPGVTGPTISRTPADSLIRLSNFLRDKYGYATGSYQGYANEFKSNNDRLLVRFDYNVNAKNKINFSFMALNRKNDQPVNSTSAAGGSVNNARVGAYALSFANSTYSFKDVVRSYSGEWVSNISNKMSNQLVVAYTHVQDTRSTPSSKFPFVDIGGYNGADEKDNYMSFGNELFSYKNDVIYNTLNVYNNFTYDMGIHHFTGGVSYQNLSVGNSYFPYGTMYYRFGSLQDFINNAAPTAFGYTYAYDGQDDYVRIKYGLAGLYAQDRIDVNKDWVVTGGLRLEMPFYLNKLTRNPTIDTLTRLLDPNGNQTKYDAGSWPNAQLVISPRVAFNWHPSKLKALQVRGGAGVFLGQLPFVWFTNQPSNNGSQVNNVQITDPNILSQLRFTTDFNNYPEAVRNTYFVRNSKNSLPGQLAIVDKDFKMPRVLRGNIAAEYKLPFWGLVASGEFIYTKDIYAAYIHNANLPKPTGVIRNLDTNGVINPLSPDSTRPFYSSQRIYSNLSGAYILTNTTKGEAYSFTAGLARSPKKGLYASLYYTFMVAKDVTPNTGSQASSVWFAVPNTSSPNNLGLAYSDFYRPHRVVGSFSYRFEYLKHLATTVSIFYEGYAGGRYSYTYSNDMNYDNSRNDLIYIPKNASELAFTTYTVSGVTFTAQQQAAAFENFINQDKYLSKHRGEYAERNGAGMPFYQSFDIRIVQEAFQIFKKNRYGLAFSVDMLNFANFLNKDWGVQQRIVTSQPLEAALNNRAGQIVYYKFRNILDVNGKPVLPTSTFDVSNSTGSVWRMQLGLRFTF